MRRLVTTNSYVALITVMTGVVVAVAALTSELHVLSDPLPVILFATALAIAQLLPVPISRGAQLEMVGFEEAVVIPLVLALSPIDALIAVAASALIAQVTTRSSPVKAIFNISQLVLSVASALAVVALVSGAAPGPTALGMLAAVVGLCAMYVVNQVCVAGILKCASGDKMLPFLTGDIPLKFMMLGVNIMFGLTFVLPVFEQPVLVVAGLFLLIFIRASARAFVDAFRTEHLLRDLHGAMSELRDCNALGVVATRLAETACQLVYARRVEVALIDHDKTFYAYVTETGTHSGESDEQVADHHEKRFSVPLTSAGVVIGHLHVLGDRRAPGVLGVILRSISRRDEALLGALADQAATALDNASLLAQVDNERRTFSQVFEYSTEGILLLDTDGIIIQWNASMERITGYSPRQVVGKRIEEFCDGLKTIAHSEEGGVLETVLEVPSGDRRSVIASYGPVHESASLKNVEILPEGWVVVLRDVTAEFETERLKNDFVATVSHELRTPLTSIVGFIETMRRDDFDLGSDQAFAFLDIMRQQSARLDSLIANLLDITTIDVVSAQSVNLARVNMCQEIKDACADFATGCPEANIHLILNDSTVFANIDRLRLRKVLNNLLENSFKHAHSAEPIMVSISRRDGTAQIIVEDTGQGIPASELHQIFERFYVTPNSVTRVGGGTGIGLYLCRQYVQAMHGSIHAQSAVGEGTRIEVNIPLAGSFKITDYGTHSTQSEPAAPSPAQNYQPPSLSL